MCQKGTVIKKGKGVHCCFKEQAYREQEYEKEDVRKEKGAKDCLEKSTLPDVDRSDSGVYDGLRRERFRQQ